ncbi:MAG: ATP synthase F1 subunit delta [Deltaproteobacteria bacterium]|nr:ATP synthase F1 subunit delta [Deltaproteobacteria bacterium]
MIDSKMSRRYARALLSLGQEEGQYAEYGQNLQEFADFCSANDEFFRVVSNQIFAIDDRKKIVETVLEKSSFSHMVKNFLRLLLDKNRIGLIKDITDHYSKLTDEISNITRAEVITARPLKEDAVDRLVQALKALTSKDVEIEVSEDASIMGGLIVKAGGLVLDGSVKTQLEGLRESLKRGEYN